MEKFEKMEFKEFLGVLSDEFDKGNVRKSNFQIFF